ncbi:histidine kinase, partial [Fischerella thermalis CCMEE 5328]
LNPIKKADKPRIEITTEVISQDSTTPGAPDSRWVAISIRDNGSGMSQELKQQILDSLSVKKRADKETSLAVSYRIITARHGGKFHLFSEVGVGTKFTILLPLL